jgi:molybdopterin-synthase adenylyltransferase
VKGDIDFAELSKSIGAFGSVQFNDFLLKCSSPPYEITLFKDGRAIVKGTEEASLARSVYSKMVGL